MSDPEGRQGLFVFKVIIMYAVRYSDNTIHPLNGANNYLFKLYDKFETFKEAKEELVSYWENMKYQATANLKEARKIKEIDLV